MEGNHGGSSQRCCEATAHEARRRSCAFRVARSSERSRQQRTTSRQARGGSQRLRGRRQAQDVDGQRHRRRAREALSVVSIVVPVAKPGRAPEPLRGSGALVGPGEARATPLRSAASLRAPDGACVCVDCAYIIPGIATAHSGHAAAHSVDDAGLDQVLVLLGRGVEAVRCPSGRLTLSTTIEPSIPAFSAMRRRGSSMARRTMLMPADLLVVRP